MQRRMVLLLLLPFVLLFGKYVWVRGFHDAVLSAEPALMAFYINHILNGQVWYVGTISNGPFYHLGPSLFYLFTPAYWLGGKLSVSLFLAAIVFNAGCVLWWRRYLATLPVVSVLIVTLALFQAGPDILLNPDNAWINVVPMGLFVFMVANLANGHMEELPWAVLIGSFLIQCHYGAGLTVLALLIAALLYNKPGKGDLKYIAAAFLVLTVMWILPVIEEIRAPSGEGNISRILHYYFISEKESPRTFIEVAELLSRYFVLPVKFLPHALSGWPESVILMTIQTLMLVWAVVKARANEWSYLERLGVLSLIGTITAFISVAKIHTPMVMGWYVWWVWGISTATLCVIFSVIVQLHPLPQQAQTGVLVVTALMSLWPLCSDPMTWPPGTNNEWIRAEVKKLGPNPVIDFPKGEGPGGVPTAKSLLLYRDKKPFTVKGLGKKRGNYNWPLGLEESYSYTERH